MLTIHTQPLHPQTATQPVKQTYPRQAAVQKPSSANAPKFSGNDSSPGLFTWLANGALGVFGYKKKATLGQTLMAPTMEDLRVTVLNSENSKNLADFVTNTLDLTLTEEESKRLAEFGANTVIQIGNQVFVPETAQHIANWVGQTADQARLKIFTTQSGEHIANWAGQTADQARLQIFTPQAARHLGHFASESASQAVNQLHEPVSLAAVTATENTASRLMSNAVRQGRRLVLQNYEPLRQIGYGAGMATAGYYVLPYVTTPAKSTAVTTAGVGMMGWGTYGLTNSLGKPNDRSKASANALSKAAQEGAVDKLKQLISRKASINRLDEQSCSALYRAAEHGQVNAAQFLIDHGADLQLGFPLQNRSPLWIAAQNGHTEMVSILIDNGAAVNMADENGITPLKVAQTLGHNDIVQDLLSVKALGFDSQFSPPEKASQPSPPERLGQPGSPEKLGQPIPPEKLGQPGSPEKFGQPSPPKKLGQPGSPEKLGQPSPPKKLGQPGSPEKLGQPSLPKKPAASFLQQLPGPLDQSPQSVDKLCEAIRNDNIHDLKELIKQGVDFNALNSKDWTPLYQAALNGKLQAAEFLVQMGAKVEEGLKKGNQTPLWAASCNGYTEIVKMLINAGAKLNTAGSEYNATPLWLASHDGHTEIAKMLINKGADLNTASSESNQTPLWVASCNGHPEIVKMLINAGADLNTASSKGNWTPLRVASNHGYTEIAEALRDAGAKE